MSTRRQTDARGRPRREVGSGGAKKRSISIRTGKRAKMDRPKEDQQGQGRPQKKRVTLRKGGKGRGAASRPDRPRRADQSSGKSSDKSSEKSSENPSRDTDPTKPGPSSSGNDDLKTDATALSGKGASGQDQGSSSGRRKRRSRKDPSGDGRRTRLVEFGNPDSRQTSQRRSGQSKESKRERRPVGDAVRRYEPRKREAQTDGSGGKRHRRVVEFGSSGRGNVDRAANEQPATRKRRIQVSRKGRKDRGGAGGESDRGGSKRRRRESQGTKITVTL